jgi:hypothetical protein
MDGIRFVMCHRLKAVFSPDALKGANLELAADGSALL